MTETRIDYLEDMIRNLNLRVDHLETHCKTKEDSVEKKSNKMTKKIPRGYMSCREFASKYSFISDVTLNTIINSNKSSFSNCLFQSSTTRYFNPLSMIRFIDNDKSDYKRVRMSLNRWKDHNNDLSKLVTKSKEVF